MKSTDLVKKQRQNVTYLYFASFPFSLHSPPQTTTIIPTPPLGPLQPAACLWRSPLTSAARLGSVPALWALDGCGWSEKQSAVCGAHGTDSGRPAQTHQMTHKQPAGLFACLLHTPTNKRHTWRWVICAATGRPGIMNAAHRGALRLRPGSFMGFLSHSQPSRRLTWLQMSRRTLISQGVVVNWTSADKCATYSDEVEAMEAAAVRALWVRDMSGIPAGPLLVFFLSHLSNVSVLTLSNTKSSSICGCRER